MGQIKGEKGEKKKEKKIKREGVIGEDLQTQELQALACLALEQVGDIPQVLDPQNPTQDRDV